MAAREYSYTAELEAYQRQNPRSAARFAEAQQVLAGGNSRLTAYFAPFPFYVERGEAVPSTIWMGIAVSIFTTMPPRSSWATVIPRSPPQ